MGLFWLFLFRFRNNRIHGINFNFEKIAPTCFRSGNGIGGDLGTIIYAHALECQRTWRPRWFSRQKCPKGTRILSIPSKPHSFHSIHSAIGSRMNGMIFRSFRKRNSPQKNRNTVYSEYSYSGIVPKESALRLPSTIPIVHSVLKSMTK